MAATICEDVSGSSSNEALLNPCVASAAAEEARVERKERLVEHASSRSGLVLEESKSKWRRIGGKEQPVVHPP